MHLSCSTQKLPQEFVYYACANLIIRCCALNRVISLIPAEPAMPIVSSLILPHGAMVFDGGEGCTFSAAERIKVLPATLKDDCQALFQACREAADMAKATKPEVIFLNTPHGICMSNHLCVYLNSRAKGNAEWNDQWTEYNINVTLDSDLARAFLEHLQKDGIPAEGMRAFTACEAPLRWGEVIPLWFFRDLTAGDSGVKVVIFSNPLRKMREDEPLSEAAKVGRSIEQFLSGLKQQVLYVVSGDLAHSHKTDCILPLYLADPRWNMPTSDDALTFDLYIEHWIKCTLESGNMKSPQKTKEKYLSTWDKTSCKVAEKWLSDATGIKNSALSCGIYGFGMLHGILSAEVEEKATIYDAHLFCRLAPTYYGMVVAAFIKKT